ncbi:MAG: aldolase [Actinomycetota bacterium]
MTSILLTDERWNDLLDTRLRHPERIRQQIAARRRRPLLGDDGHLFLVAADHPARGALSVRDDATAMADRRSLLDRILVALENPRVDGVMASPDVIDDLAVLGALDGRIVVGSMNRGGLLGSVWELDDRMTGYDTESLVAAGFEGGKMLLRIDDDDAGTLPTLEACAAAVSELAAAGLMAMLEPLPYRRVDGRAKLDPSEDALIRAIGVASALGTSTAHTWMKLPATADVERVMATTSMPTLLLGGAPGPDPEADRRAWARALAVPHVRGYVIGRSLLYPPDGDVAGAVGAAADLLITAIEAKEG